MSSEIITVSDADFDEQVLKSDIPVLVDFWAPWCGPCLAIAPTLDALAGEYSGRLRIAKINVDENNATSTKFGVRSIPYMAMFKGGEIFGSVVGAVPKAKIVSLITSALK